MEREERRKRFNPQISLGSVIATLAFVGSGVGIYTNVIADVEKAKTEIVNLKIDAIKREAIEKESRQETKQDIRDIRTDVKEVNIKIDKVLQEVLKRNNR